MSRRCAALTLALVLLPAAPAAAAPEVLFPSDRMTVRDGRQATGRRVNLPRPDCRRARSDCDEIRLINGLDGFDLDPRIAIRFDRAVNLRRAEDGITLRLARGGKRIGIDRLVWDSRTRTLYAHPASQLQEARRYRIDVSVRVAGRFATSRFTTMSATATQRRLVSAIASGTAYDQLGVPESERGLKLE